MRNAGAIFVGPYAPVSLGDYLAGSNHVLPTGGTARHTGGLSVLSFLRGIHLVEYDRAALAAVAPHIDALGGAEDLAAHVEAVRARIPAPGGTVTSGVPRVRDDLAGHDALRRAAAGRGGPAEHQREPVPAAVRAGRGHRHRGGRAPPPG